MMKVYMFKGGDGEWLHIDGATLYRINSYGRWDMARSGLLELIGKARRGELEMEESETTEFVRGE